MLRTSWEPERESASARQVRDRLLRALAEPEAGAPAASRAFRAGAGRGRRDGGTPAVPPARTGAGGGVVDPPDGGRPGSAPSTVDPPAGGADTGIPDGSPPDADPGGGWPAEEAGAWRPGEAGWQAGRAGAWPGGAPRGGLFGAFDPGRRGVRALVAAAVLALLGAAVFAWYTRPRVEPVAAGPSGSAAAVAPSGTAEVVVAVSGRVRRPGLLHLPPGARVADALRAAGGPLPGTDLSQLNLARPLTDGELVVVGVPAAGASSAGDGLVNLNTATIEQLDGLPGVGPTLAQRIVDYRAAHGGFRSVDQLREVDGIGPSKFAQIRDKVSV